MKVVTPENPMGIYFCPTCQVDTMLTPKGMCLFCDTYVLDVDEEEVEAA